MEPASSIIKLCGGFKVVANMVNRSEIRVRRWTYPKSRGGTDGLIPSDVQQDLLNNAQAAGIALKPEHFFLASKRAKRRPQTSEGDAA